MKYFSMFSGIGGFELGVEKSYTERHCSIPPINKYPEQSKPDCIGFSEIDKYAIQIYEKRFQNHKGYGDATKIRTANLPDFDFLCGGFPCQAFSIAGKRAGFQDTRGTLFFEIARILADKRPKHFLLENVKGLLSHDDGRTFQTIVKVLTDLGYGVEWQVLNSKDFGVPQNRERVFIIGHLGGFGGRKVFPIARYGSEDIKKNTVREIHEPFPETQRLSDAFRIRSTEGESATLKGLGGGMGAKTGLYAIPVLTPDREEKRQNGRRMKEDGDPSFTLTAQDKHGVFDGYRIRRLTPTECERLQGFPDGWTEGISDSQRYKCLGNAVTVNVIQAIMCKLGALLT